MNYKAFSLILFVLIFCLSSTMTSRKVLLGSGNSKMQSQSHHPRLAGSATTQPPPVKIAARHQHLTYGPYGPVCNEKVYGNCIRSPPTVPRCNYGVRCKRTIVP
ncbi:hypothetical protein RDI58_012405 [Solanum bulbocastanum]|uniref:Uncharacterized protein n=1 Tax=Solanum bulbocastanum TaxID=147425 RepID=A0AAN8YDL5_SOLBU